MSPRPPLRTFLHSVLRSRGSPGERAALELMVAWGRTVLAVVLLVAIHLDPTEPAQYVAVVNGLLVSYTIYSASALALLRFRAGVAPALGPILHILDLLWAFSLTLWTEGPGSQLFLLFVFAVLSAAYRWGLRETLLTTAAAIIALALEAAAAAQGYTGAPFQLNYVLIRSAYLALFGLFLGLLSERQRRLRREAAAIAGIMRQVRVEAGPAASMHGVLGELASAFDAERALLAVEEVSNGRLFLWAVSRHGERPETPLRRAELDPAERGRYFFHVPDNANAWRARWPRAARNGEVPETLVLDAAGRRADVEFPIPGLFRDEHPCRSLVSLSMIVGEDRIGRLFLVNPSARPYEEASLALLQAIGRQVGPALENLFLVSRLRTRIEEMERSRVARELHDGVVQSLIGLEMQLDVARRGAAREPARIEASLDHIERLLHQEILNLRDLMQRMRPTQVDCRTFISFLATAVDRFRRNTGIGASFVSEVDEVELLPRACRELARVVEEALVNVRKHSGARNVTVRLGAREDHWRLAIEDDGRGFGFTGRLTLEELNRDHVGPLRVLSIGGTLAIESAPGRGARLDITLPRQLWMNENGRSGS
jgi:signal transduction histidine kinase